MNGLQLPDPMSQLSLLENLTTSPEAQSDGDHLSVQVLIPTELSRLTTAFERTKSSFAAAYAPAESCAALTDMFDAIDGVYISTYELKKPLDKLAETYMSILGSLIRRAVTIVSESIFGQATAPVDLTEHYWSVGCLPASARSLLRSQNTDGSFQGMLQWDLNFDSWFLQAHREFAQDSTRLNNEQAVAECLSLIGEDGLARRKSGAGSISFTAWPSNWSHRPNTYDDPHKVSADLRVFARIFRCMDQCGEAISLEQYANQLYYNSSLTIRSREIVASTVDLKCTTYKSKIVLDFTPRLLSGFEDFIDEYSA